MSNNNPNQNQDTRPRTKEELIRRIKETSKMEVILEEMIRLGFWNKDSAIEQDPTEEIKRRGELERELAKLREQLKNLTNEKKLLDEARKKRWQESLAKRKEKKAQKEKEREEKKKQWAETKKNLVNYLGEGVSTGLSHTTTDNSKLQTLNLPIISSAQELASNIGIELGKLRWLTYHRDCATICHYHRFTIPKRRGGDRNISSPKKTLRIAQNWVKSNILDKIELTPSAHGFIKNRSIVSNAQKHLNKDVVINIDLKDFFPSITFKRVRGMFRSFGYSGVVSTLLALICTEPPRKEVDFDGKIYNVAIGERQLPQGACTSPAITNILCKRLDNKLVKTAESLSFQYTRYADDITFSGSGNVDIGRMIKSAESIIKYEGFELHPEKTRVLRKAKRQEVTGLVVNSDKPTISRKEIRKFKAILHNCEKYGIESQNKDKHPNFIQKLKGYCSFISMVDEEKGKKFSEQIERICKK